jgi:D-glycero-D-manno-heptose 1,7-bisphosphate phosphatase
MSRPAVLLDRDGTLNVNPPECVRTIEEFEPISGAFEAVGRLCRAGWPVAVVTNQAGVARGVTTSENVRRIHDECGRLAARFGGRFDGFHVCPHAPEDGCSCRKPLPGLLLEAAEMHGYDLLRSYMIGDSLRDLLAGRAAGATPLLVLSGHGPAAAAEHMPSLTFPSLAEAANWILAHEARSGRDG